MSIKEDYLEFKSHTRSKLKLLEYYLTQWDRIVGRRRQRHYIIDCTAGTGYNIIANIRVKGSALIACDQLRYQRNLEILLIEKEQDSLNILEKVIKENLQNHSKVDPDLIDKVKFYCADCYDIMDSILNNIGDNISLFLMDPYGPVFMNLIEKIGSRTLNPKPFRWGTEIFIYFNAPYINHYGTSSLNYNYKELIKEEHLTESELGAKRKIEEINRIYGDDSWQEIFRKYSASRDRIINCLKVYIEKIKKFFRFVIPLKVSDIRGRLKYFFIFVTNHFDAFNLTSTTKVNFTYFASSI